MIDESIKVFNKEEYHPSTVIGEFSGRDSVAAIMKAFESDDVNYILPIATLAGTEFGDFNILYENFVKTKLFVDKKFKGKKVLYPLFEYNRSDLWHLMNGRVLTQLNQKYGFYNPCIGCHLYFHLTKLPFASQLSKRIISGERSSHDGRIKVNQLDITLETYKSVLQQLGYELLMPLQYELKGSAVQDLIDWPWLEGVNHPICVLSGNYRDASGKAVYDKKALEVYLDEYIMPLGSNVSNYLLGHISEKELKEKVKIK